MAKVSLNKIAPIKKKEPIIVKINGEDVIIQQYLPQEEKNKLIERVLNASIDGNNFFSGIRLQIFTNLEIIETYTNINFTETMKKDPGKLYDLLVLNNILAQVQSNIPQEEIQVIQQMVLDNANRVSKYSTSFLGVLNSMQQNQQAEQMDFTELIEQLKNTEGLELVKDIVEKIG